MAASSDTIYALSSAVGKAAIAVVRLSGDKARFVCETLCRGVLVERKMNLKEVYDRDGCLLDRALVTWFQAPHSYTGEDCVEFYLHGGRAVVTGMLDCLSRFDGVRSADPGEFTYRAFLNGRMDLSEVEGVADLLNAETALQRVQALRQASGKFRQVIETYLRQITVLRSYLEATIDFSDEDTVPDSVVQETVSGIEHLVHQIDDQLHDYEAGERLREGFRVVLAGQPNAGKSSLLNALARRDVALVCDEPGTTRDVIEVHLDLKGLPITFIDTAGFRDTLGVVERQGQKKAQQEIQKADLVFWLHAADQDALVSPFDGLPVPFSQMNTPVLLWTKTDILSAGSALKNACFQQALCVSIHQEESLRSLLDFVYQRAFEFFKGAAGHSVPTRLRHKEALLAAKADLVQGLAAIDAALPAELIAEPLRLASFSLERIIGKVRPDDLLDVIFAEFCIGK